MFGRIQRKNPGICINVLNTFDYGKMRHPHICWIKIGKDIQLADHIRYSN